MAQRKGLTPTVILLTDGRANIALDGSADRTQASIDAAQMAQQLARAGTEAIVIDTGIRPARALRDLAASLRGHYLSLPRADAQKLSQSVQSTLDG